MQDHCRVVFDEARTLVADGEHGAARRLFCHLGSCDAGDDCPENTACTALLAATTACAMEHQLRRLALTYRDATEGRLLAS